MNVIESRWSLAGGHALD